jgi:hypothetical protein
MTVKHFGINTFVPLGQRTAEFLDGSLIYCVLCLVDRLSSGIVQPARRSKPCSQESTVCTENRETYKAHGFSVACEVSSDSTICAWSICAWSVCLG